MKIIRRTFGWLAAFLTAACILTGCSSLPEQAARQSTLAATQCSTAGERSPAEAESTAVAESVSPGEENAAGVNIDASGDSSISSSEEQLATAVSVTEDGAYFSKDEVAFYIFTYGHLPENFITKKEARALGWEGGPLEPYAPGKAIGGDYYGNYEGTLPDGPTYHECDIDTEGKSRGAKRIVYSDDGKIYYTNDHYETFTLLYENGANQS